MPSKKTNEERMAQQKKIENTAKWLNMALKEKEESAAEGEIAREVKGQEEWEAFPAGNLRVTYWYPNFYRQYNPGVWSTEETSIWGNLLEFNDMELMDVMISLANTTSAYAALQKKLEATNSQLNTAKNTLKDQRHVKE